MQRNYGALGRDQIRQANQRAAFNAIHQRGLVSRSELTQELRLSAAALTTITSEFIASGLVYEAEQGISSGVGRKPVLLKLNYDYGYVFGVKISNVAVTTALTNLEAEVLAWRSDPLAQHDAPTVIQTLERAVTALRQKHLTDTDKVVGLGVGLPGIVDITSGQVRSSPLLGWEDTPLAELLQDRFGIPVLVENDVNALTAASAWFGPGKGHADFLVVTLGRGVGLGITLNGQLYRGPQGGAGEFGHSILDLSGATDEGGGPRTVEAFLADEAMLSKARKTVAALAPNASVDELVQLAQEGNEAAIKLFDEAGTVLGQALSNLVNIFGPTLIVLSGEGMRAASFMLPAARQALQTYSFADLAAQVKLVVDAWGDEAWAQGAAGLMARRFLTETAPFLGGDKQLATK